MINHRKRKKYFIDKVFQSTFIFKFCLVVLISSVAIAGLILWMTQDSTTVAIYNTKVQVKQTSDFIQPMVVSIILAVTILSALVVIALTLLISHSIAGPLFRIKREVDLLAQGSLKVNFSLRAKDQLKDLAQSLDRMAVALKENRKSLLREFKTLKKYLEARDYALSSKDKESVARMIRDMEKEIQFYHE